MRRLRIPVEDYTTPSPVTACLTTPLAEIVSMMEEYGIRHVPIIDHESPVGIISDRDTRVAKSLPGGAELTAQDIMIREPFLVAPQDLLEDVALAMGRQRIGSAIVTEKGKIAGIFTVSDALNALIEIIRGEVS